MNQMKRKKHLLFIFAIAMMPMIAGSLSSCNADDDYSQDGTLTLSKGLMTRAIETTPKRETVPSDSTYRSYEFTFVRDQYTGETFYLPKDSVPDSICVNINVLTYRCGNKPVAVMTSYTFGEPYFTVDGVGFQEDILKGRYFLCASGHDCDNVSYTAKIDNLIFF